MKILYVHGLGSTAGGNTVTNLGEMFTTDEIISHDVPIDPMKAVQAVREWSHDCDLVIGSSLGGFYAQFADCPKVLINPALQPVENLMKVAGKGTFEYFGPREDGVQEYTLDDEYYQDLGVWEQMLYASNLTDDDIEHTSLIFGTADEELGTSNLPLAEAAYGKEHMYFLENMGHRFNPNFMYALVDIINKTLGAPVFEMVDVE